jgi:iron(III) transport system ATP-binding protein
MREGQLVQHGTPAHLYQNPADAYVAGLFGKYTLLNASFASALSGQETAETDGKDLFVRPERFSLDSHETGLKGKVTEVTYYGAYYEVIVLVENTNLLVRTDEGSHVPGHTVSVSLKQE